jgi:hypothetical protein
VQFSDSFHSRGSLNPLAGGSRVFVPVVDVNEADLPGLQERRARRLLNCVFGLSFITSRKLPGARPAEVRESSWPASGEGQAQPI